MTSNYIYDAIDKMTWCNCDVMVVGNLHLYKTCENMVYTIMVTMNKKMAYVMPFT